MVAKAPVEEVRVESALIGIIVSDLVRIVDRAP